jgi:hypothetical protein
VTTNTPKLFRSEPIRAELTTVMDSFPSEDDQRFYISQHPVVFRARNLIRNRTVRCALCAFYEWSPIVNTHKLKRCSHRDEAGEVHPWLNMFRHYRARGCGPGARCSHCRFPIMLCWRTVYREKTDLKYGSDTEARESEDHFWYYEVRCTWVKAMQRFVASCMVFQGRGKDGCVSPARRYGVRHDGVARLERVGGKWTRAHSRMVKRDGRDGTVAVSTATQTVLAIS